MHTRRRRRHSRVRQLRQQTIKYSNEFSPFCLRPVVVRRHDWLYGPRRAPIRTTPISNGSVLVEKERRRKFSSLRSVLLRTRADGCLLAHTHARTYLTRRCYSSSRKKNDDDDDREKIGVEQYTLTPCDQAAYTRTRIFIVGKPCAAAAAAAIEAGHNTRRILAFLARFSPFLPASVLPSVEKTRGGEKEKKKRSLALSLSLAVYDVGVSHIKYRCDCIVLKSSRQYDGFCLLTNTHQVKFFLLFTSPCNNRRATQTMACVIV